MSEQQNNSAKDFFLFTFFNFIYLIFLGFFENEIFYLYPSYLLIPMLIYIYFYFKQEKEDFLYYNLFLIFIFFLPILILLFFYNYGFYLFFSGILYLISKNYPKKILFIFLGILIISEIVLYYYFVQEKNLTQYIKKSIETIFIIFLFIFFIKK